MMLSQFFVAAPEAVARAAMSDLPISPKFKFRGVDTIKLATLEHLAVGTPLADALGRNPCIRQRDGGGPWVYQLNATLTSKLADMPLAEIGTLAQQWAQTDEWQMDRGIPQEIEASLAKICDLAKMTRSGTRALFLWITA